MIDSYILFEAKKCPFCGGVPVWLLQFQDRDAGETFQCQCGNDTCNARGPSKASEKAAINAWNSRKRPRKGSDA